MCIYVAIYTMPTKLTAAMAVKETSVGYEYACHSELVSESYAANLQD